MSAEKSNASENKKVFLVLRAGQTIRITLIVHLFNDTVPITASKFHSLCTNSNGLTYANSPISRIIAPEFILQAGSITSTSSNNNTNNIDNLFTRSELSSENTILNEKGLICVAATEREINSQNDSQTQSIINTEFFITLSNGLHHFKTLQNKYIVIGKVLKGLDDDVIDKLGQIKVDGRDRPVEDNENAGGNENQNGQSFIIEKCGELRLKSNAIPKKNERTSLRESSHSRSSSRSRSPGRSRPRSRSRSPRHSRDHSSRQIRSLSGSQSPRESRRHHRESRHSDRVSHRDPGRHHQDRRGGSISSSHGDRAHDDDDRVDRADRERLSDNRNGAERDQRHYSTHHRDHRDHREHRHHHSNRHHDRSRGHSSSSHYDYDEEYAARDRNRLTASSSRIYSQPYRSQSSSLNYEQKDRRDRRDQRPYAYGYNGYAGHGGTEFDSRYRPDKRNLDSGKDKHYGDGGSDGGNRADGEKMEEKVIKKGRLTRRG